MFTFEIVKNFETETFRKLRNVINLNNAVTHKSSSNEQPAGLPPSLMSFYTVMANMKYEWETIELVDESGNKLKGGINLIPANEVLEDGEGSVYFKDINDDEDIENLKRFRRVDLFVGEACTGYMETEPLSDEMHYLDYGDSETIPMGIGFDGYLELMLMARGFLYWQVAVIDLGKDEGLSPDAERFKTYMPQIFPDFKWEEFVGLYEKVKIK